MTINLVALGAGTLGTLTIIGEDADEFEIDAGNDPSGDTFADGDPISIDINLASIAAGSHTASVRIPNDSDETLLEIPITGNVVVDPTAVSAIVGVGGDAISLTLANAIGVVIENGIVQASVGGSTIDLLLVGQEGQVLTFSTQGQVIYQGEGVQMIVEADDLIDVNGDGVSIVARTFEATNNSEATIGGSASVRAVPGIQIGVGLAW